MEKRIDTDKGAGWEALACKIGEIAVRNGPRHWNLESSEEARKQTLFYARDEGAQSR
jgi:hypothetical protein